MEIVPEAGDHVDVQGGHGDDEGGDGDGEEGDEEEVAEGRDCLGWKRVKKCLFIFDCTSE